MSNNIHNLPVSIYAYLQYLKKAIIETLLQKGAHETYITTTMQTCMCVLHSCT